MWQPSALSDPGITGGWRFLKDAPEPRSSSRRRKGGGHTRDPVDVGNFLSAGDATGYRGNEASGELLRRGEALAAQPDAMGRVEGLLADGRRDPPLHGRRSIPTPPSDSSGGSSAQRRVSAMQSASTLPEVQDTDDDFDDMAEGEEDDSDDEEEEEAVLTMDATAIPTAEEMARRQEAKLAAEGRRRAKTLTKQRSRRTVYGAGTKSEKEIREEMPQYGKITYTPRREEGESEGAGASYTADTPQEQEPSAGGEEAESRAPSHASMKPPGAGGRSTPRASRHGGDNPLAASSAAQYGAETREDGRDEAIKGAVDSVSAFSATASTMHSAWEMQNAGSPRRQHRAPQPSVLNLVQSSFTPAYQRSRREKIRTAYKRLEREIPTEKGSKMYKEWLVQKGDSIPAYLQPVSLGTSAQRAAPAL